MSIHPLGMTTEQLREAVVRAGQPAYRADQIADWLYRKGVADPDRMSNLPAALTEKLVVLTSTVLDKRVSHDGTIKLLIGLSDGERIETVLIPAGDRVTACLSAQAGCAYGCAFCASGLGGLRRNLAAEEILEQLVHLRQRAERRISNVVFMGMGEPLANYDATLAAVRAIIDPGRFGVSARSVTVSTVGLPGAIRRLAAEKLPITLAISLHAPTDELRRRLMPRAARHSIEAVLDAARAFHDSRRREITLEYCLIGGENDSPDRAGALAGLARRLRCSVNLIRYNPAPSLPYARPSREAVRAFADRLRREGVNATVRRSRGIDADAACGQLRRRIAKQR